MIYDNIQRQINKIVSIIDQSVVYREESLNAKRILIKHLNILGKSQFVEKEPNADQENEFRKIISSLENLEYVFTQLTKQAYPTICFEWEIQKPMLDIMTNMNMISLSLSHLGFTKFSQYMPSIADLKNDFQSLYGIFSQPNEKDERKKKKLDSIINFLKKHNIPLPGEGIESEMEKMFENLQGFKLEHSDFEKKKKLGVNSTSTVYRAKQISTGKNVALKEFKKENFDEVKFELYQKEISYLSIIKHPNLIGFVGATSCAPYWVVNEYISGGNLHKHLFHQSKNLSGYQKTVIAYKIAEGMAYLHSKSIVHRDLKPSNILLTKKIVPKIINFRTQPKAVKDFEEGLSGKDANDISFLAPEVLSSLNYGYHADVYSFGMILYQMYSCKNPYKDMEKTKIIKSIIKGKRFSIDESTPQKLKELISICLDYTPLNRPTFEGILINMREYKVAFPLSQDEEESLSLFYQKNMGKNGSDCLEEIKQVLDLIQQINSQISDVVVYKKEIVRMRAVLDGYNKQIHEAPFAKSKVKADEFSYGEQSDIKNLITALKDLKIAIQMITEDYWMQVALEWSVLKPMSDINKSMTDIYVSLNQLGLNIIRYEATKDDIAADFKELFDIYAKAGVQSNQVTARLNSLSKFMDSLGIEHPPMPPSSSEIITRIFESIKNYKVFHSQFDLGTQIGSGSSGDVFEGVQKDTNHKVAIKQLISKDLDANEIESIKREIVALSSLHHRYLVRFIGATPISPYWLITEFVPGLSLFHRLHKKKGSIINVLTPLKLTKIAYNVAEGMEFLHSKNMIHRDLKSLNVLLDANDDPKICDFGLSRMVDINMTKFIGTSNYMAPEVISDTFYSVKADVFSYGLLLCEMVTKEVPYTNMNTTEISEAIIHGVRPKLSQNISEELQNLIKESWSGKADQRPSFKDILAWMRRSKISFPGTPEEEIAHFYADKEKELLGRSSKEDQPSGLTAVDSFYH